MYATSRPQSQNYSYGPKTDQRSYAPTVTKSNNYVYSEAPMPYLNEHDHNVAPVVKA